MVQERRGRFRFAKQIGGWGAFADVGLTVYSDESDEAVVIDVVDLHCDPRHTDWIAGLRFGVQYALEDLPTSERDVSVRITRLHTNPVDSSAMAVAFAACFAVWDAVGFVPQQPPILNENTKEFVFPS